MSPLATRQPGWADALTERASSFIERRTSRRGFIGRTAMVGSALTVAGSTYVLKPTSAYAATCNCLGRSCNCADLCCDGYTEFCCHLFGENSCPPNTILAGWWKVDNSSYCDGAARYYMDCNKRVSCGCGSSGVCKDGSTTCQCRACGNRKDGCTMFRYGNCNNDVSCVGPIMCRVVTCTKPWEIDPGCTTVSRTDNNTRFHHRPCLEPPPREATDAEKAYVRALYRDFLGRDADASGFDYWTERLARGEARDVVAYSFAFAPEYVTKVVRDLYRLILDRAPDTTGERFWRDQLIVGMTPADLAAELFASEEFWTRSGATNGGFVDQLFRRALARTADPSGRQYWIDQLDAGATRTFVAREIFQSIESRRRRVAELYQRFLGRSPDESGRDYWVDYIGNGRDIGLALYLAASDEYTSRALRRFPGGAA